MLNEEFLQKFVYLLYFNHVLTILVEYKKELIDIMVCERLLQFQCNHGLIKVSSLKAYSAW